MLRLTGTPVDIGAPREGAMADEGGVRTTTATPAAVTAPPTLSTSALLHTSSLLGQHADWSFVTDSGRDECDDAGDAGDAGGAGISGQVDRCMRFSFTPASSPREEGLETRVLVKGNKVFVQRIQSRGAAGTSNTRKQQQPTESTTSFANIAPQRVYTLDSEPLDVLWASFPTDTDTQATPSASHGSASGQGAAGEASGSARAPSHVEALCVVEPSHIMVIAASGEIFTVRLPFEAHSVRAFSTGLLITRMPMPPGAETSFLQNHSFASTLDDAATLISDGRPILYTLSHPLEELRPLLIQEPLTAVRRKASPENNEVELAYRGGIRPLSIVSMQGSDVLLVYDAVARCTRIATLHKRDDTHRFQHLLEAAMASTEPRIRIRTPYATGSALSRNVSANASASAGRASGLHRRRSVPHSILVTGTPSTHNDSTASGILHHSPAEHSFLSAPHASVSHAATHHPQHHHRSSTPFAPATPTADSYRRACSTTPTSWSHHQHRPHHDRHQSHYSHSGSSLPLPRSLSATPTALKGLANMSGISAGSTIATPRTTAEGETTTAAAAAAAAAAGISRMDLDKLYPRHVLKLHCCVTCTACPNTPPVSAFLTGTHPGNVRANLLFKEQGTLLMVPVCKNSPPPAPPSFRHGKAAPDELRGRWMCPCAPRNGAAPPGCEQPTPAEAHEAEAQGFAKAEAQSKEGASAPVQVGAAAAFPISFVSPAPHSASTPFSHPLLADVLVQAQDRGLHVYTDGTHVCQLQLQGASELSLSSSSIAHVTSTRFSAATEEGIGYRFLSVLEQVDEQTRRLVRTLHTLSTVTAHAATESKGSAAASLHAVTQPLAGAFPQFMSIFLPLLNSRLNGDAGVTTSTAWEAACEALLRFIGHAPLHTELEDDGPEDEDEEEAEEDDEEVILPVAPAEAQAQTVQRHTHQQQESASDQNDWWEAALSNLSFDALLRDSTEEHAQGTRDGEESDDTSERERVSLDCQRAAALAYVLHTWFEETRLFASTNHTAKPLAHMLMRLCASLGWKDALEFYLLQSPDLGREHRRVQQEFALFLSDTHRDPAAKSVDLPANFSPHAPFTVEAWSAALATHGNAPRIPVLASITPQLHALLSATAHIGTKTTVRTRARDQGVSPGQLHLRWAEEAIETLARLGFTEEHMSDLKPVHRFPLQLCVQACMNHPPESWSPEAYRLVQRNDLALQNQRVSEETAIPERLTLPALAANYSRDLEGEEQQSASASDKSLKLQSNTTLSDLRFPCDRRIKEAARLLDSGVVCTVHMTQEMGLSDHDFMQEQKRRLLYLSNRTFGLAVGRGMFLLGSVKPIPTQALQIQRLVLSGHFPAQKTTLAPDFSDLEDSHAHWPHFHNGVSAAVQLAPSPAVEVGASWIPHHEAPHACTEEDYAGFLFGLGLQGHLPSLSNHDVSRYLKEGHELVCIALLLGMASARPGTMDVRISKMLAIHLEDFLPPTSHGDQVTAKITINTQTAALVGMGLLYRNTCHRRIAEVMLAVIGRPPCVGLSGPLDREGFSLGAGFALGLIVLGKGGSAIGLEDLALEDVLYHYIKGARKRTQDTPQNMSPRVLENDMINTHVTSPAAIVALGLMYLKTNNAAVAARLALPDTLFLLDTVRPDFLLLLVVSRALILWEDVRPTREWIQAQLPQIVARYGIQNRNVDRVDPDTLETVRQAEVYILAGACFALGLRYAGTAKQEAVDAIMEVVDFLRKEIPGEEARRINPINLSSCLRTALLGASMVMAGTGYIPILRVIRVLRSQTATKASYGHHMATHMAVGLLFLGGGTMTLSRSNEAIAALMISLFPKFPLNTIDNRYHLQALRHLYTLAAVPRMLVAKEVTSDALVHVPIVVTIRDDDSGSSNGSESSGSRAGAGVGAGVEGVGSTTPFTPMQGADTRNSNKLGVTTLHLVTPCLLPTTLDRIVCIDTVGHRYFQHTTRPMTNARQRRVLMRDMTLFVKLRPGRVPYRANTLLVEDLVRQSERLLGVTTPRCIRPSGEKADFGAILSSEQHVTSELTDQELAVVNTDNRRGLQHPSIAATLLPQSADAALPLHVASFGQGHATESFLGYVVKQQPHAVALASVLSFLHRTCVAAHEWIATARCSALAAHDMCQLSTIMAHIQHTAPCFPDTFSREVQGMLLVVRDRLCAQLAARIEAEAEPHEGGDGQSEMDVRRHGRYWCGVAAAVWSLAQGKESNCDEDVLAGARAALALLSLSYNALGSPRQAGHNSGSSNDSINNSESTGSNPGSGSGGDAVDVAALVAHAAGGREGGARQTSVRPLLSALSGAHMFGSVAQIKALCAILSVCPR